jgi:redox-sensitive bicupin YhaK (pirin superfamily)
MTTAPARSLGTVLTTPAPKPGFIGAGHLAVEVVTPDRLADTDPFVLLMDDRLDIPQRRQIGGAHPHAGLETVTLVLEGEVYDRDEGTLRAGDVLWMNAGRGVVHNEHVEAEGRSRILQLWIRLPAAQRASAPDFQRIRAAEAPTRREGGAEVRVYSGASGGLVSPTRNRVPVTMVDVQLRAGGSIDQELPASYQGFLYVLDGRVRVGDTPLAAGQVGWLAPGDGPVRLRAPEGPIRLVLYAGAPQREPLVHHGPFVGGSPAEIHRLFQEFRTGTFEPLSHVGVRQRS